MKCLAARLGMVLAFLSANVYADSGIDFATPKIYVNGEWKEAAGSAAIGAPNSPRAAFGGHLLGGSLGAGLGGSLPLSGALARNFLLKNGTAFGLAKPSDLDVRQIVAGEEFSTVRLSRTREVEVDGRPLTLEVKGGETLVHVRDGRVLFASAAAAPLANKIHRTTVNAEAAKSLAYADYGPNARSVGEAELKLVLLENGGVPEEKLAYAVRVRDGNGLDSETSFIDAATGDLLYSVPHVLTHRKRLVLVGLGTRVDEHKLVQLIDANAAGASVQIESKFPIYLSDVGCAPGNLQQVPQDPLAAPSALPRYCYRESSAVNIDSARLAWRNSGLVWEYFKLRHGRDSFDGRGAAMKSVVHFMPAWANAAWIDEAGTMVYGDGDPNRYHPFARALDVAAHELTHAITSRTANLTYAAESGALNESYSDVFGKLVAAETQGHSDWKVGKEIFKAAGQFIRDMQNPEVGHVSRYRYRGAVCTSRNDNCGVHSNSGIPNRAAVLIAERIGREALGKIYYRTLTQLLRPGSGFADARTQTLVACELIFGRSSEICAAVDTGFAEVGIR